MTVPVPELSGRPFELHVERAMDADAGALYQAFAERFDSWFATPGTLRSWGQVDQPFFFEVQAQGNRYPHYGRFLRLVPDQVVELTWVTGAGGTEGAETVLTVEFEPRERGALVRLHQAGFASQSSASATEQAWPAILAHLDDQLK
jgi:uncharacterized protein YndB with AHSA1/START domain